MYQTIFFDLDGTLTEPSLGILNSIRYALDKLGAPIPDEKLLLEFIGPPLEESFMHYCRLSAEESKKAIAYYREYFSVEGLFENQPYEGISQVLSKLKEDGKQLIVATSKPEIFARQILEHFDLDPYFNLIAGANLEGTRSKKADVIAYALDQLDDIHHQTCIMIGDRKHDIIGATANKMDSIGVLYGFGDQMELETAGATYIIEEPLQLLSILEQ